MLGGDPKKINPLVPVDLVIDHSVVVEILRQRRRVQEERRRGVQAEPGALQIPEMGAGRVRQFPRRAARHRHLPSGQSRISVADGLDQEGQGQDRRQGRHHARSPIPTRWSAPTRTPRWSTASSVLGWGVGGIEAEAAMLGQPMSMLLPEVIGFKLTGKLKEGVTATDLVLTVTQMLRERGVVGKFVEFFGPGLADLSIADRATHRQHGAGIRRDLRLLPDRRRHDRVSQGHRPRAGRASRWSRPMPRRRACSAPRPRPIRCSPTCSSSISRTVEPSLAGPEASAGPRRAEGRRRPASPCRWTRNSTRATELAKRVPVEGRKHDLGHGDVVIAAITSCTNTSNPSVMVAAGLLARKAAAQGPDRQAVGEDLARAGLAGRRRISTTSPACRRISTRSASISSASAAPPASAIPARCRRKFPKRSTSNDLVAAAVLSGNRNFEGRVNAGRARELSRLAAAGRRLRDRRLDADRSGQGAARHRQERQEGLPEGHLADQQGNRRRSIRKTHHQADVRARNTPTCSRATPTGARSRSRAA